MRTAIERLPDGSDYVAILHGPIVLAARTGTEELDGLVAGDGRMAHVSPGPYLPLDGAPMLVGDPATLAERTSDLCRDARSPSPRGPHPPATARDLELVPFFRVHDSRYMMYWRAVAPDRLPEVAGAARGRRSDRGWRSKPHARSRHARRAATGGRTQMLEATRSTTGVTNGRSWREAAAGSVMR